MPPLSPRQSARAALFLAIALALSLLAGFNQVKAMGLGWQEEHYLPGLKAAAFLAGYGVEDTGPLIPTLVQVSVAAAESVGVPRAGGVVLVLFRVGLNALLMLASFLLLRRFGVAPYAILLGWSALAWSLTHTTHGATLALESTMEAVLCVGLACACLDGKRGAMLVLAALLMLNNNALLPIAVMMVTLYSPDGVTLIERYDRRLRYRAAVVAGVAIVVLATGGLRPEIAAQLHANLFSEEVWRQLALTLGILPFLAALGWRSARPLLRRVTILLLPLSVVYNFALYDVTATHVFLTPLVVCVLPMALMALDTGPGRRMGELQSSRVAGSGNPATAERNPATAEEHPPPREARGAPFKGGRKNGESRVSIEDASG